jgi:tetratricopeptide (TPR) repeat protein
MKRCIFFLIILTGCIIFIVAQQSPEPYWLALENGKALFQSGNYGDALIAFETAKRTRYDVYNKYEQTFIDFLSLPGVRALGDSFDSVKKYALDKNITNVQQVLDEIEYRFQKDMINNSVKKALDLLSTLKYYPEAEYWIGEVYRVQGEYKLALQQYQRAYNLGPYLEEPDFAVHILYTMAEILRYMGNYVEYENTLLKILEQDALWSTDKQSFMRTAMYKTIINDGINQFLVLYRYDNTSVEKSHRLLGFYYYSTGRYDRALDHLIFSFLIQNTVIIQEIRQHDVEYTFTDYTQLINQSKAYSALEDYMEIVDYYKTVYYLGASLFAVGQRTTATFLWKNLAAQNQAGEWQRRAQQQLKKPYIEPVVEKP